MKKPILFLDIDGVLQPYLSISDLLHPKPFQPDLPAILAGQLKNPAIANLEAEDVNRIWNGFDHASAAYIRALAKEFQAGIVITSSWTMQYSTKDFQDLFAIFSLSDFIQDSIRSSKRRCDFIRSYIEENDIENYLVIDDLDMRDIFENRQILTSDHFTEQDYEKARELLQSS